MCHSQVQSTVVDSLLAQGAAATATKPRAQLWPHHANSGNSGRQDGVASAASAAQTPTSSGNAGAGTYSAESDSEMTSESTLSESEDADYAQRDDGEYGAAAGREGSIRNPALPADENWPEMKPVVPAGGPHEGGQSGPASASGQHGRR
jgi:hypothetical protein